MVNRLKHLSSQTAGNTPPAGVAADRGRIAFNLTDRKLWGFGASGAPQLLAALVTDHLPTSAYRIGDLVVQGGVLYRCIANIPPKAFTLSDWSIVGDFRGELLFRAPTTAAQARMTMAAAAVGLRVRANAAQSAALQAWENAAGDIVSDIRADGYPGAAFARPVFRVDQVAHGFTAVGQAVRFTGANWVLADASIAGGTATAVVHRVISANAVELQTTGRIDGLQAGAFVGGGPIVANTRYYLSVANPGQLTAVPPPNPADENLILQTLDTNSGVLYLQVPVGVAPPGAGGVIDVTQSPNPFTAVGQVAAVGGSGWRLADPATAAPLGIVVATAGNDFAIALSGEVVGVEAAASTAFPLTPGTVYYATSGGLLTPTPSVASALGAGPVLVALTGTSGIVIAGQASPNVLRASQNLAELTSAAAARTNLGATTVGAALFTAANASGARTTLGATTVGNAVFTAGTDGAARTALGATALGSTLFTIADGSAARTALGATPVGDALFTSASAAAARTALGATTVGDAIFIAANAPAARTALGATAVGAAVFTAASPAIARAALEVAEFIAANPYLAKVIGEPFPLWTHLSGVVLPDNSGTQKYIRLRAGQAFNSGLLTSESVTGSAPLVEATAVIAVGPLAGQTVRLLETEGSFLRPGTSGVQQMDQMQQITGRISTSWWSAGMGSLQQGALSISNVGGSRGASGGSNTSADLIFDSANSPDARVSSATNGETRPKNVQASYYMRIV